MPHLWHWYAFPSTASMDELGEDWHTTMGDFMPFVRLSRRIWAGRNIEFLAPLHVGEDLKRRITIANIAEKTTAGREMVVISLDHEMHGTNGLAVLERQDIVYLQVPDAFTPPKKVPVPELADIARSFRVSTRLLFRYSAITFTGEILGDLVCMDDTEIAQLFDMGVMQSPNFAVARDVA